ncbi:alpha/beta fold hydrolase [Ulvibacterium sp.]|uniref:alpha/beta fold hydrolase n=1 Tax=Ulvibacterium sp. TaxID=2665914 RepID=UPI003BAD8495
MSQRGTIFYIHGNSSSNRVFENILVSDKISYQQIAPNLPGHGKKAGEDRESNFTTKGYCDFLLSKVNSIEDDILLVGNSLGGHLALEIVPKVQRLKGLVIFGAPPVKKPLNVKEAFNPIPALQTFLKENPENEEIENALSEVISNHKLVDGFVNDFKTANPKVRTALADDLSSGTWSNQAEIFLELHIPKLVIIGDKDVSVNTDYIKNLANQDKDLCELVFFEKCGHYASIEKPLEFENILTSMAKKVFNR